MSAHLRLMAVHAHPDDESSKGAATMARYVAEGVEVLVATCTGGERGSVLNPAMDRPDVWENLPAIRQDEMARAREILGVKQAWLGYVDSGLPEGDPLPPLPDGCFAVQPLEVAAAPLVKLIREFKPQVILTYDEEGGYPHPDHIMCHQISMEAWRAAGDPERYTELGEPWQPQKIYYHMGFSRQQILELHHAVLAAGLESPYEEWLEKWQTETQDKSSRVTTRVRCESFFSLRDDALRAHATQVDPTGRWFAVPLEIQQKAWPTEDYELVESRVATDTPEDDLFAGLR